MSREPLEEDPDFTIAETLRHEGSVFTITEETWDSWFRPYKSHTDDEIIRISEDPTVGDCARNDAFSERQTRGHTDTNGMPLQKPKELEHVMCEA